MNKTENKNDKPTILAMCRLINTTMQEVEVSLIAGQCLIIALIACYIGYKVWNKQKLNAVDNAIIDAAKTTTGVITSLALAYWLYWHIGYVQINQCKK